jgi:hypothetical protein
MLKVWKRFRRWWKQRRCEHFWRPARESVRWVRGSDRPVKVCDYCGKVVELTPELFYAQFGRMPW